MSIIFGIRKPHGEMVSELELRHLAEATSRFAFDGLSVEASGRIGMGFQPYYTNARSNLEAAVARDNYGNLLTFDGRLDNYQDLCDALELDSRSSQDSAIALAAFRHWGQASFSRFIGDWALVLWSKQNQSLYLARDHAGARTLYFLHDKGVLRWSTYFETFFIDGATMPLDMDYAACYLACQTFYNLTPYKHIQSVLPAHYVVIHDDKIVKTRHWDWMCKENIRYNSDSEYEEHFLALFKQSIERRTGPGAPILAQLSGGMDSTSIVCMSDHTRSSINPSPGILDTISFYDDSEPSWNEKPYFSAVESQRGKVGIHLETSFLERTFTPFDRSEGDYFLPGADSSTIRRERRVHDAVAGRGYRVVLSGIGGDEVLGGVPSALPELADYLVSGQIRLLLTKSLDWCLLDRTPIVEQLSKTIRFAIGLYRRPRLNHKTTPPWLRNTLRSRCAQIVEDNVIFGNRFGLPPHVIDNGLAWWFIMETLPHTFPQVLSRPEYRYPYLDRDLVDYLFRIPHEQLIRAGRRRSLMKRALRDIVPALVLVRPRKAFLLRGILHTLQNSRTRIDTLLNRSLICSLGLVESIELQKALEATTRGRTSQYWPALIRAIDYELWLQSGARITGSPA